MRHGQNPGFHRDPFLTERVGVLAVLCLLLLGDLAATAALPQRLVVALDGVSYRDMRALQEGLGQRDLKGRWSQRRAFQDFYPVSRMVSTFPSASDVAWTEMFGNCPLPGYQRTYYCRAANLEVFQNGVTTSMEYERQMTWQEKNNFMRALGYLSPRRSFKYEVHELGKYFLQATNSQPVFYALIRGTDEAQHLSVNIFDMLCTLDQKLQELCAVYREREGRELEILILSDHGNNHAGPARRVAVRPFLKQAGYRITGSIRDPKDVVLPTAGIETWVEVHNHPSETERLVELLSRLPGADLVTGRDPGDARRFFVANPRGERAVIEAAPAGNRFRYVPQRGDPLDYRAVVESLAKKKLLDAEGYAAADDWMAETLAHRYPLALERIAHGHTRAALNPATILISLDNDHVHSGFWVKKGSEFIRFGGTHGALDDLNSVGILLSNFKPTQDTSASRIAAQFEGFQGLRDYRAEESGAEWVSTQAQSLPPPARATAPTNLGADNRGRAVLRIWGPELAALDRATTVEVSVRKPGSLLSVLGLRGGGGQHPPAERRWTLNTPVDAANGSAAERCYAFPDDLSLEPDESYILSGCLRRSGSSVRLFRFAFRTDGRGMPVVY
jgi:hypothetical protein